MAYAHTRLDRRAGMKSGLATLGATVAASAGPRIVGAQVPADGQKIVGDVTEYALTSDEWSGAFGWVTFKLHMAWFNGEPAYHIRTDASDPEFAQEVGAVLVPKLAEPLTLEGRPGLSNYYLFGEDAAEGQQPVISSVPGNEDFSPAFHIHRVTWTGQAQTLTSEAEIKAAEEAEQVKVEVSDVVANYPIVKWPGGELPADQTREAYLGDGQLITPPDTEGMTVTFKLHECFPSSRYIVTDTSHPGMAGGMNVGAAVGSAGLSDAGATARIWVFGNGVPGTGPMGGQPSVFDSIASTPAWSPFWDHLTVTWAEEAQAEVLRSMDDIEPLIESGALNLFNGVPNTHPNGFIVNCPVPVIATNTFGAAPAELPTTGAFAGGLAAAAPAGAAGALLLAAGFALRRRMRGRSDPGE